MRFLRVELHAPPGLSDYYEHEFGISQHVGETELEFLASEGEPLYHFAFLVPGDRFAAALEWAQARTTLLADRESGETVFEFDNWDAQACYFEDPAGNIVELVAHRGIEERGAGGAFDPAELVGISELGLVGDTRAMAAELGKLGLDLWDGTLTDPERLAFVGEQARTLILSPPGRGWMPTGRPAEEHPVTAVFPTGSAMLSAGALVIDETSV